MKYFDKNIINTSRAKRDLHTKISFDGVEGTPSFSSKDYVIGKKLGTLPTVTLPESMSTYTLKGWYGSDGTQVTVDTIATADMDTLTARYEDITNYMTLQAYDGGATIKIEGVNSPTNTPSVEYRIRNARGDVVQDWTSYTIGSTITLPLSDYDAQFRGNNTAFTNNGSKFWRFTTPTGKILVRGSVMTLIDKTDTLRTVPDFCFFGLFYQNTQVLGIESTFLPATSIGQKAYFGMFRECKNESFTINSVPNLPATTIGYDCYEAMFMDSYITVVPPILQAQTKESCFKQMFRNCVKLESITMNMLSQQIMKSACQQMFAGCTALTNTPYMCIHGTSGAYACAEMFADCTSLKTVNYNDHSIEYISYDHSFYKMFKGCTALETFNADMFNISIDSGATYSYQSMFEGCTALKEFNSSITCSSVATGTFHSMFKGCTSLTTAPTIPSFSSFGSYICDYMFEGCTSLNNIEVKFTDWPNGTTDWMLDVSSSGTFKCKGTLSIQYDSSHVPYDWTIETEADGQLEYIQFNGNTYFDLMYAEDLQNTTVHFKAACTGDDFTGNTPYQCVCLDGGSWNDYQFAFWWSGYSCSAGGSYDRPSIGLQKDDIYEVEYNSMPGHKVYVNDKQYSNSTTSFDSTDGEILFGIRAASSNCFFVGRVYTIYIMHYDEDSGELETINTFQPWRLNGKVGLYNQSTDEFLESLADEPTPGPNV